MASRQRLRAKGWNVLIERKKWQLWQLLSHMLAAGWQPTADGKWRHPEGAVVDLNANDVSKRSYWHQLAERHVTPPTSPVPF
jgi:hypothetical protein